MSIARGAARDTEARGSSRALADRLFFGAMALYCAVTILGGFVPTFLLRGSMLAGAAPLRPIVALHGVVFTAWVTLFVAQTALIAAGARTLHRRLGPIALGLAGASVLIGLPMIVLFERGHGTEPPLTLAVHLAANVAPLLLFAGFTVAGVYARATPDVHKRLMLFATLALQPAGFARLVGHLGLSPDLNVPAYGALCAACVLYDVALDRRIRAVTLAGTLLLFGELYGTDVLFRLIQSPP
jgi:hypothetical protein